MRGRWLIAAVLACYFGLLVAGWAVNGRAPWPRFRVPTASTSFADMRSITTGWVCTRRGVDVLPLNPCDPSRRPANYPRVWTKLSWLGLGEGSTVPLGVVTAAVFLLAVLALAGPIGAADGVVYVALLVSPTVMFGVERANADLLVFVLVVLAVLALERRVRLRGLPHGLLLLAAVLKLFPVFAFTVLLREPRRAALASGAAVASLFALYIALTWDDVRTIYEVVPKLSIASYGFTIGPDILRGYLARRADALGFLAGAAARAVVDAALLAAAAGVVYAIVRRRWARRVDALDASSARLPAFWAGASIYAGTFLLGHNFDYRLVFLLLTVPQLLVWSRQRQPLVPWPRVALGAMFVTLWVSQMLMPRSLGINAAWRRALDVFPPEQALDWFLFVYLLAALVLTVPRLRVDTARSARPGRAAAGGARASSALG